MTGKPLIRLDAQGAAANALAQALEWSGVTCEVVQPGGPRPHLTFVSAEGVSPPKPSAVPSLVVWFPSAPSPDVREAWRYAGAAAVVVGEADPTAGATLQRLLNTMPRLSPRTGLLHDTLHQVAHKRLSALLVIGDAAVEKPTFFGRLYLDKGRLVHSETPFARGPQGLGKLLEGTDRTFTVIPSNVCIYPDVLNLARLSAPITRPRAMALPAPTAAKPEDEVALIASRMAARSAVCADAAGSVQASSGEEGAETLAAVAATASRLAEQCATLLGLGEAQGLIVAGEKLETMVIPQKSRQRFVASLAPRSTGSSVEKLRSLATDLA